LRGKIYDVLPRKENEETENKCKNRRVEGPQGLEGVPKFPGQGKHLDIKTSTISPGQENKHQKVDER